MGEVTERDLAGRDRSDRAGDRQHQSPAGVDPHDAGGLMHSEQPMHMSKPGRERNALDEYKPHEDAYVAALMAPRPDADLPMGGWARTWAAYMAFVVGPVKAWIGALRR